MYELHTYHRACVYVCGSMYRHTLLGLRKVFHFIRAVSLEIASDETVRGDEPSAAVYVLFFQDTFSMSTHIRSHAHTESSRTIIKKIGGEGSLLICLANCDTSSPSNPSTILDPIIFQEKPRRSLFLQPISESLSSQSALPLFLPGQWNMDICVAIYTDGWRARVARGFHSPQKWNTFTTMAFRFPFVAWNLRNGFCESASILASRVESRSVTHVFKCLLSTSRECSGKVFWCTEKYFSDIIAFPIQKRHDV